MPSLDLGRLIQRLDGELVVALEEAVAIAVRNGHESVEAEHWIAALGDTSRSYRQIAETCGGDVAAIEESANRSMERFSRGGTAAP